ncbi:hypothetical protein [Aquihabitans sp. McL0605]|uniref:hypothetical protein n=1 Tax=Aquihabitans sp. McL0605 TaxID=3415671 RepID=UPI003CF8ECFB
MGRVRSVPRSRVAWHRRLRLHPAAIRYWLLVAALACVVAAVVAHAVQEAATAQQAWGRTRTVLVATRHLAEGEPLAGATRSERWPVHLVPVGAVDRLPTSARAGASLDRGVPLTASAIQPPAPGAGDRRSVAVPLADAHLPVERGDRVDVWATRDPTDVADGDASTVRVARDARVLSVDDQRAVLSVPPAEVPLLAEAAARADLTLVGSG